VRWHFETISYSVQFVFELLELLLINIILMHDTSSSSASEEMARDAHLADYFFQVGIPLTCSLTECRATDEVMAGKSRLVTCR
jgi:hypothetical protein